MKNTKIVEVSIDTNSIDPLFFLLHMAYKDYIYDYTNYVHIEIDTTANKLRITAKLYSPSYMEVALVPNNPNERRTIYRSVHDLKEIAMNDTDFGKAYDTARKILHLLPKMVSQSENEATLSVLVGIAYKKELENV